MYLYLGKMRKTSVAICGWVRMHEWWYWKTCKIQTVTSWDSSNNRSIKNDDRFQKGINAQAIIEWDDVKNQVQCFGEEEQVNVKRSKDFLRICKRYCEYVYRIKRESSKLSMLSWERRNFWVMCNEIHTLVCNTCWVKTILVKTCQAMIL